MSKWEKTLKDLIILGVLVEVVANIIEIVVEEHPEIVARACTKLGLGESSNAEVQQERD